MNDLLGGIQYMFGAGLPVVAQRFAEHLRLLGLALGISMLIALPLGVLLSRVKALQGPVLSVLSVIYTIPSLSLFVLLIPIFRLGVVPAVIGLVAYAQLVLVRNTLIGLTTIDPSIKEAARGMGMSAWQQLWRVELPLAMPLIVAGMRLAAVSIIGIGTIAAFINAGGLGALLFEGVTRSDRSKIVAGAIAVSALALAVNGALRLLERRATRATHEQA